MTIERDDLQTIIQAVDYAAESREYEASYESDKVSRKGMEENAAEWSAIADKLRSMLETEGEE